MLDLYYNELKMRTQETEIAWAAGFFDGEGHSHFRNGCFSVSITQSKNCEVLLRFRSAVGDLGRVSEPHYCTPNPNPRWTYSVHGKNAILVMQRLWPHLGTVKRNQAQTACDMYKSLVTLGEAA